MTDAMSSNSDSDMTISDDALDSSDDDEVNNDCRSEYQDLRTCNNLINNTDIRGNESNYDDDSLLALGDYLFETISDEEDSKGGSQDIKGAFDDDLFFR